MIANKLPAVLFVPSSDPQHPNSLSMERAIKNALAVLENVTPDAGWEDRHEAAISDLETMLKRGFE